MTSVPNLTDRILTIVREWPQWSRAEREKLHLVEDEILSHCRNGTGNGFIRKWCDRHLGHLFREETV